MLNRSVHLYAVVGCKLVKTENRQGDSEPVRTAFQVACEPSGQAEEGSA